MIAIKGIDMPQNCLDCPLSFYLGMENLACIFLGDLGSRHCTDVRVERHKDCPLVEVKALIEVEECEEKKI